MDEDGLAFLFCILTFYFLFGGDGGADLGEGGREVGRGVVDGGTRVAVGDADELDASPISSEGAKRWVGLLDLLEEFVMAAEVPAKADLG